ncbi:GNAT family N-acetyltransferase [Brevundimonas sp. R86498]|uniref:GNAT family N-acetyltransferase n=1 Tax=Brevundimonas sp. R86498 TaxID=3093845 RepID=UPI0037C680D3
MIGPVLTTPRLTLAPVTVTDLDEVAALWGDEAFTRPIAGRGPLTGEEVWFRLLRDLGHWAALGRGNWSIRLTATGDYVGGVGVLDYRRECLPVLDAPELGWGVAPRYQGQGLAREAVDAALDWCDRVLRAPRTVCMIDPLNAPSLKLAERVGYRHREPGRYQDKTVLLLERAAAPSVAAH